MWIMMKIDSFSYVPYGWSLHLKYCIMQIVRCGKLSRFQHLVEIRGENFRGCVIHAILID